MNRAVMRKLMTQPAARKNRILGHLPADDFERIAPHLDTADFVAGQTIVEAGQRYERVYFPASGVLALVTVLADGSTVESATIGYEGMAGVEVFLGVPHSWGRLIGEVPGSFFTLPVPTFTAALPSMPHLRMALSRYTAAMFAMLGQTGACNRVHHIRQRAARCLLMIDDRARGARFSLTQDFLAQLLGVGRPGLSLAAAGLQEAGAIKYARGRVRVVDRRQLEEEACECYFSVTAEFNGMLD